MDDRGKLVRLPMKYIKGRWVLEYGGDLPIEHGASGQLCLEASSIEPSKQKDLFLKEERFQILPEGTALRVLVDVRDWSSLTKAQAACLHSWEEVHPYQHTIPFPRLSPDHCLVEVQIGRPSSAQSSWLDDEEGGLWLRTEGVTSIGLLSSQIALPSCVSNRPAQSLNHAYTLLSELFEPWRRTHTGSVYRLVFYKEGDGNWYPLRLLRDNRLAVKSQQIAYELWLQMSRVYASVGDNVSGSI